MSKIPSRFSWGHININVSNLERSIQFYEQLGFEVFMPAIPYLGLDLSSEAKLLTEQNTTALGLPPETPGRACIMQLDKGFPKLDLTELAIEPSAKPLTNADLGIVRICLASNNLVEDHQRLSELGISFISPPQPCKDGLADIAVCVDPDGTLIELLQVYLEKWAR